jgi:hypothetical protein
VSCNTFAKQLVEAFPTGVPAEPTLMEKMNPWEEQKDPFVAWIIANRGT